MACGQRWWVRDLQSNELINKGSVMRVIAPTHVSWIMQPNGGTMHVGSH